MTHTVGRRGQVVIPKALRDRLGIRPGTQVTFFADAHAVTVTPVRTGEMLRGRFKGRGMAVRLEIDRRRESQ